jgi:hypothetical protein
VGGGKRTTSEQGQNKVRTNSEQAPAITKPLLYTTKSLVSSGSLK